MSDRRERWRDGNVRLPESTGNIGWETVTDRSFNSQPIKGVLGISVRRKQSRARNQRHLHINESREEEITC